MFKCLSSIVALVAVVAAKEDAGYGSYPAPSTAYEPYPAHPVAPSAYGPAPSYAPHPYGAPYHSGAYPAHGGYYRKSFPRPRAVLDPKYYESVLKGFSQCVEHKCKTLPKEYTSTPQESLATLGKYTACVTSCAASEMMRVVSDFKGLIGKLIDIGSAHLKEGHLYLAGKGDYDVLGNNTHIKDSCCLPDDYFVPFEELVFGAMVRFPGRSWNGRLVSVKAYLEYCVQEPGPDAKLFLGKLEIDCDLNWMKYLTSLQKNIGHLVLAPKCKTLAPRYACSKKLSGNPQSEGFGEDMCVAYECVENGKRQKVTHPVLKYPEEALTYAKSCEPDEHGDTTIYYRRVPRHAVKYYTLTSGLPSSYTRIPLLDRSWKNLPDPCEYGYGLVGENNGRFEMGITPNSTIFRATYKCPRGGLFEYCNMKQYVSWLQDQLFDVSKCPINGMGRRGSPGDSPYAYYTLACLYRVISLKCDCMEAVLNCYDKEYQFTTTLGKTVGKAASVLCGFILCQKPKVYSLLGGQEAIENANIMKQVLMQVGAISPSEGAFPPVTIAFMSFGLAVVCFFATKAAYKNFKQTSVGTDDGYRNLI